MKNIIGNPSCAIAVRMFIKKMLILPYQKYPIFESDDSPVISLTLSNKKAENTATHEYTGR